VVHKQPGEYLVHLLKHALLQSAEASNRALAPFGVDGKEFAVLLTLAASPGSQQDAARRLGIDRTTMVALLDALAGKGLVQRSQDPADRRRNVVGLTEAGRDLVASASAASEQAERDYLAPLTRAEADDLIRSLRKLVRRP
jgi:DNA-binding MarR family transcriptional regulator